MAKCTVIYACGHTGVIKLVGPSKERGRKLDWLATRDCPRCQRGAEGPVAHLTHNADQSACIDIVNSYEVRHALADRGYTFGRERVSLYMGNDLIKAASSRPVPAWWQLFRGKLVWNHSQQRAETDCTALRSELDWIIAQGWGVVDRGSVGSLLAGIIEGRPETV